MLLLFLALAAARVLRVGPSVEYAPNQLAEAIAAAVAGDTVELSSGQYLLPSTPSGVLVTLSHEITIRAATNAQAIVRAATADGTDVLFGIGSSGVRLENLIIGRPAAGSPVNVGRIVAVLVSAGTQDEPSVFAMSSYNDTRKRSSPLGAIHAARELAKRTSPELNRVLAGVVISGVDFTASQSHTNLGIGAGAYSELVVENSRFAEERESNALVTAPGALFDASTVERNVFGGSPVVDRGHGLVIGPNYWAPSLRTEQSTFCIDRACTRYGPIVDGDQPAHAYACVADAVIAGVKNIRLTVHDVEWSKSDETACTIITRADTSIEGFEITSCAQTDEEGLGVPTINLRPKTHGSCLAGIQATEGALASIQNVEFNVHDGVTTALSIGVRGETEGTPAATLLLDHVTIYGHAHQTALLLSVPSTRVVLNEFEVFGTSIGIAHMGGLVSITDSVFLTETTSIRVAGAAKHGLRVLDTLFFNKATAISFGDVKATSLVEFAITCSRFLFAGLALPHDCTTLTCAAAIRHNTFIVDRSAFSEADRALIARGGNHYEEDSIDNARQYYAFTADKRRSQFSFTLHDHQGRIDDASGVATISGVGTHWDFMLATHIPLRQECFASAQEPGENSRVVSNLFDLRTDAPSACVSVALRVALREQDLGLAATEALAIYSVARIGSPTAKWTRAPSHTTTVTDGTIAVDASGGSGRLLRAVVIIADADSLATPEEEEPEPTLAHSALAITRASRQLCVACGGDRIPAGALDEHCGGASDAVFTDLDAALAAVASSKTTSVSLLVYGDKCVTRACSVELGVMAPNKLTVQGLGPSERGAVRRRASCPASTAFIRAGTGVTLRYLLVAANSTVPSAMPLCAVEAPARNVDGPSLAYLTIGGGVCIGRGRANTILLNNEISVSTGRAVSIDDAPGASLDSNVFAGGIVRLLAAAEVTNNAFSADAWLEAGDGAQLSVARNTFAPRRADATTPQFCMTAASRSRTTSFSNTFGDHCELRLSGVHTVNQGNWLGVRATLAGTHVVGVTFGAGTVIRGSAGVVLENVVLDESVGDTLRGASIRSSSCAKAFEPAVGGFDLEHSTIFTPGARALNFDWPTTAEAYVDYALGALRSCDDASSEYCDCLAYVKHARGREVVASVPLDDSTPASTSINPLWIILGVAGGLLVCFIVLAAACLCVARDDRVETVARNVVHDAANAKYDFGTVRQRSVKPE